MRNHACPSCTPLDSGGKFTFDPATGGDKVEISSKLVRHQNPVLRALLLASKLTFATRNAQDLASLERDWYSYGCSISW